MPNSARAVVEGGARRPRHQQQVMESAAGRVIGDKPFSRDALYLMLRNHTYCGEIVHEGQSHPGEHPPIIDQPLWDAVQMRLAGNIAERSSASTEPARRDAARPRRMAIPSVRLPRSSHRAGGRRIRNLGPRKGQHFFKIAAEPGETTRPGKPEPDFDDRQGQVYRAPSQAGPGNDINAGSPGFQNAPTRSLPAWSRDAFSAPSTN